MASVDPHCLDEARSTREPTKTLRDEFAMAALPGLLERIGVFPDELARQAYRIANSMMEARNG